MYLYIVIYIIYNFNILIVQRNKNQLYIHFLYLLLQHFSYNTVFFILFL